MGRKVTLAILGLDNAGKTVTAKSLQGGKYYVNRPNRFVLSKLRYSYKNTVMHYVMLILKLSIIVINVIVLEELKSLNLLPFRLSLAAFIIIICTSFLTY